MTTVRRLAGMVSVALVGAGALVGCAPGRTAVAPPGATASAPPASGTPSAPSGFRRSDGDQGTFRSVRGYRPVAGPRRLRIPAVRIDTPIEPVGLAGDGTIAPPSGWQVAGWYSDGPRPGHAGPAVIVGHVDSTAGPAVFYRLAELRAGDAVYVDRADGTTVRFRVSGLVQVHKDAFPAGAVYAATLSAALRLVTCGGRFDHGTHHYVDNVVVSAVPG